MKTYAHEKIKYIVTTNTRKSVEPTRCGYIWHSEEKIKIILYSNHVYSTTIAHYDISLELVTDPSHWPPLYSSSIEILFTLSREKASLDPKAKSSGIASKETATSEPTSETSSTTEAGTLEETSLSESLLSQTTASFRRRIKMQSSLTSTSATKTGIPQNHAQKIRSNKRIEMSN